MMIFPIGTLMDEQHCYGSLLELLPPEGVACSHGHPLPSGQSPHDRHRDPIFDYRCHVCGAVYNIFTDTIGSVRRYSCVTIVLILNCLDLYVAMFGWAHNLKRVASDFLRSLMAPSFTLKPT